MVTNSSKVRTIWPPSIGTTAYTTPTARECATNSDLSVTAVPFTNTVVLWKSYVAKYLYTYV